MGLGGLLEVCQVHEKVALKHSSKSTKYELDGSYDDLVHEKVPAGNQQFSKVVGEPLGASGEA